MCQVESTLWNRTRRALPASRIVPAALICWTQMCCFRLVLSCFCVPCTSNTSTSAWLIAFCSCPMLIFQTHPCMNAPVCRSFHSMLHPCIHFLSSSATDAESPEMQFPVLKKNKSNSASFIQQHCYMRRRHGWFLDDICSFNFLWGECLQSCRKIGGRESSSLTGQSPQWQKMYLYGYVHHSSGFPWSVHGACTSRLSRRKKGRKAVSDACTELPVRSLSTFCLHCCIGRL